MPCFGKTSMALHCPFLGTSVPKAQFLFHLKLNEPSFPSQVGLRLGFLPAPLGAGEGGPRDRGWLNMSSPLLPCQPGVCGSLLSVTAGLDWWAFRLPLLHTPRQAHGVLFSVPPRSPSKAPGWQPWQGWVCGITRV